MSDELKAASVDVQIDTALKEACLKFSPAKALIGLWKLFITAEFIAFVVSTVMVWKIMFTPILSEDASAIDKQAVILIWGGITALFILGAVFKKAISTAIENAKINLSLEAKNQTTKSISGTLEGVASDIIDKVKK